MKDTGRGSGAAHPAPVLGGPGGTILEIGRGIGLVPGGTGLKWTPCAKLPPTILAAITAIRRFTNLFYSVPK